MKASAETLLRIADMTAAHYREMEEFQRRQAEALGRLLLDICVALDVPVDHDPPAGVDLFMGIWTREDIMARVRAKAPK